MAWGQNIVILDLRHVSFSWPAEFLLACVLFVGGRICAACVLVMGISYAEFQRLYVLVMGHRISAARALFMGGRISAGACSCHGQQNFFSLCSCQITLKCL